MRDLNPHAERNVDRIAPGATRHARQGSRPCAALAAWAAPASASRDTLAGLAIGRPPPPPPRPQQAGSTQQEQLLTALSPLFQVTLLGTPTIQRVEMFLRRGALRAVACHFLGALVYVTGAIFTVYRRPGNLEPHTHTYTLTHIVYWAGYALVYRSTSILRAVYPTSFPSPSIEFARSTHLQTIVVPDGGASRATLTTSTWVRACSNTACQQPLGL